MAPILALYSGGARADEAYRPRTAAELPIGTKTDTAYRVITARVAVFDRFALERDFPHLNGRSDAQIEAWILSRAAYVNGRQLALNGIRNTPIQIDPRDQKPLFIQPGVGRGGDIEADGQLISLKASGNSSWNDEKVRELVHQARRSEADMTKVREQDHSSGLEIDSIAAAEYLRQHEIQADFERRLLQHLPSKETVEFYFLIDYGFDVLYPGGRHRAFLMGRQANLGRTAYNARLKDEFYTDRGKYQESYAGTRIDFGGARTPGEAGGEYHDRFARLTPEAASQTLRDEIARRGLTRPYRAAPPPIDLDGMKTLLTGRIYHLDRGPVPDAIGRSQLEVSRDWRIDIPQVARFKFGLWRMTPAQLRRTLDAFDKDQLWNLLYLARAEFQSPLPPAALRYALKHDDEQVRNAAVMAAAPVFERHPELVEPAVAEAERLLAASNFWAPSCLESLINSPFEFAGYEDFCFRVAQSNITGAKTTLFERLSHSQGHRQLKKRILEWVRTHETDPDTLKEAETRFSQNVRRRCESEFR